MVKEIVKDVIFLKKKSVKADTKDTQIITDLQDTLKANHDRCVGMAANMIGYSKRIIIFTAGIIDEEERLRLFEMVKTVDNIIPVISEIKTLLNM